MTKSGLYGCAGGFWDVCPGDGDASFCPVCAGNVAGSARNSAMSRKRIVAMCAALTLLDQPRQRDAELTCLSVQIWTLNPQCLGGVGHAPPMVLQDGRNVLPLEAQPRFEEITRRRKRNGRAFKLERG